MLTTYKATLHGNQIEWSKDVPQEVALGKTVSVQVIILDESLSIKKQGQQMAAALSKLAESQTFADVDAGAWEREARIDKELTGRDK